jgi:chitin-binding protein
VYSGADAVGNASGNTTVTFGIDLTSPTAPGGVTSASAPGTPANIVVTWTAATDALSGVAGYTVYWVQATTCPTATPANYPSSAAAGNVTSYTITPLTKNAMYCAYVMATDNAGNQSAASAVTGPTKAK